MTLIKSIRLLHAVSYVLISSQLLFYMLVLTQAMKIVTLENFMELRKAIDPIFAGLPRILYYIALLLSLVAVICPFKIRDQSSLSLHVFLSYA
jgi:hypothetical protein